MKRNNSLCHFDTETIKIDFALIGQRFGNLVVKDFAYWRKIRAEEYSRHWICKCDCPTTRILEVQQRHFLRMGKKDCGCDNRRKLLIANTTHGDSGKRLYNIWKGIINRCESFNWGNYKRYGGAGIKVCDEWHSYDTFKEWSLNNGYADNLSIDRQNYKGNYEPCNCRWATMIEQANNKSNNVLLEYDNKILNGML